MLGENKIPTHDAAHGARPQGAGVHARARPVGGREPPPNARDGGARGAHYCAHKAAH